MKLKQGVPQGCVLSPILFLFFINNLARTLEESDLLRSRDLSRDLILSLFANDVTVLSRDRNREHAAEGAQLAVNIISDWSKNWKLTLNATKSEVTFFSTWSHEAKHQPVITIEGQQIPFNPTPKLLGVIYDRTLSFETHVKELTKGASAKLGMLGSVSNSKWGWDKEHLSKLYCA